MDCFLDLYIKNSENEKKPDLKYGGTSYVKAAFDAEGLVMKDHDVSKDEIKAQFGKLFEKGKDLENQNKRKNTRRTTFTKLRDRFSSSFQMDFLEKIERKQIK